ncbi:MAG TPA: hypothetical protein VGI75_04115 [Pirellulales bacterium]
MHRPTALSVAKIWLVASICSLSAAIALHAATSAFADDASPPSSAVDSSSAAKAADATDDIPALITKLGDDLYAVSESASLSLIKEGITAKPKLVAALESPDAEVRFRAKHILSEVVEADFQRRLSAFSSDTDGKLGLSLPGWEAFQKLVGSDRSARDLFVEMQQAEAPLLEAYEEGPKQASNKLIAQIAGEPAVIDRGAAAGQRARRQFVPQSTASNLGDILAWLFVAGDSAVPITDDVAARAILLPQNPVLRNAAAVSGKQIDSRAEVCRKILARWISRDINAVFVAYNLATANQYNLKEALPSAVKILQAAQTTPDINTRIQALFLVYKFGGKEHISLLEPLLKDEFPCYDSGNPNQRVQTQIRDIALCTSIKLAGEDPKKFGFDLWFNAPQISNLHMFGFTGPDGRAAAFKKWEDRQTAQKSATGDNPPPKIDDAKSG